VDNQRTVQADGKMNTQAYKPEDITRFTDLVKQAVGFDNARGDQVTVTNVAFKALEAPEALPAIPLWEQSWFLNIMKQVGAVLAVLFILLGVLRPTMRNLSGLHTAKKAAEQQASMAATGELVNNQGGSAVAALGSPQGGQAALPNHLDDLLLVDVPHSYGKRLEYMQNSVDKDPQLVAQILKRWVR
jgi:flagellar M-ring protein FliF